MAIKVGDRVPNATFRVVTAEGPKPLTTDDVFKGKKVVLFAVPGAFTPTCTKNHLPGYINNAAAIKAKGIDTIAVTGVNDQFVMDAWKKSSGGEGKVEFLADGNGDFAKALDLTLDASANVGRAARSTVWTGARILVTRLSALVTGLSAQVIGLPSQAIQPMISKSALSGFEVSKLRCVSIRWKPIVMPRPEIR